MADTPDTQPSTTPQANGAEAPAQVGIVSQYIKDLSVENPNAPAVYQWPGQPKIDVQFNIGTKPLGDDSHEVELKITVEAKAEQGTAFIVDLLYAGLLQFRNMPKDQEHPFLFAEAPRLLFPFARRVLADAVRDAGFPPLMLEPIDFTSLYMQQRAQHEAAQAGNAPANPPAGNA